MNMVKAVCACKNISENDLVVAVRRERFSFLDEWGFWIWVIVFILTLLTLFSSIFTSFFAKYASAVLPS